MTARVATAGLLAAAGLALAGCSTDATGGQIAIPASATTIPPVAAPQRVKPLSTTLPGVPAVPLPGSPATAASDAGYACQWNAALVQLLSTAKASNLASQANQDIVQIGSFAQAAAAGDVTYAQLSADSAALNQYSGNASFGPASLGAAPLKAIQGDCLAVPPPPSAAAPTTVAPATTVPPPTS